MALTVEEKQKIIEEEQVRAEARVKFSKPQEVTIKKKTSLFTWFVLAVIIITVFIVSIGDNQPSSPPVPATETQPSISSQDKQEVIAYLEKIQPITDKMSSILSNLSPVLNNGSDAQKINALLSAVKKIDALLKTANSIIPPTPVSGIKGLHTRFVSTLAGYADSLDMAADAIKTGNTLNLELATESLLALGRDTERITQEISNLANQYR